MIQQIVATGTLKALTFELKGASSFPVLRLELNTGEKFYEFEAAGPDATRINAVIGDADAGTPLRVLGYANIQKGKDGSNWLRLNATSVAPDFSGRQGAIASIMGRVVPTTEVEKKDGGSFRKASVQIVAADRDGPITDGEIELSFSKADQDRMIGDWDANVGALAELEVELSAWISGKGRSFPRFNVKSVKFHPWPSYITAFDPVADSAMDFTAAGALSAAV